MLVLWASGWLQTLLSLHFFSGRWMIMLKKMVVALVLATPTLALAQQGPYFTMGAAFGNIDLSAVDAGATSKDDDVQRVVIGGGYNLNDSLALEGLYLTNVENTIKVPGDTRTLDHDGVQLSVRASIPFTPQFSLFGKVSANLLNVQYESASTPANNLDDNGVYLGVGLGLAYQFTDQIGVRTTFERLMITDLGGSGGDFDVDQLAVALNYSF